MLYLICLLVSFCSISYQFLLSRSFLQFSQDEVFSQSLTLGVYLLSVGLGAFYSSKNSQKDPSLRLVRIEFLLSIIGALTIPFIYLLSTVFLVFNTDPELASWLSTAKNGRISIFQIFTLVLGFLTGFEVPLLYEIIKKKYHKEQMNLLLGISYLGAVLGSFIVPLVLLPNLDTITSASLVALINIVCLTMLVIFILPRLRQKLIGVLLVGTAIIINVSVVRTSNWLQQVYVKAYYLDIKALEVSWNSVVQMHRLLSRLESVQRWQTPYQSIDIVPSDLMPANLALNQELKQDFSMYLNMAGQFSEGTFRFYHESMIYGGMNASGTQPRKVLILGGGDGLLASELLIIPRVESITLVELDEKVVEISREHPVISRLNEKSLENSKVKIIINDAFTYIKQTPEKYDAIFVDFPFPANYELGRLYSREFYSNLKAVLVENGFIICDIPIWSPSREVPFLEHPYPQEIVASTLKAAGFENQLFFGPIDGFVVAKVGVPAAGKQLFFDYAAVPQKLDLRTLLNLNPISVDEKYILESNVNSVYRPKRFRWQN